MDETTTIPENEAPAPTAPESREVTPITKASQTRRGSSKAVGKASGSSKAASAPAKAAAPAAPKVSPKAGQQIDMVNGMKAAKAVVNEKGMKGDGDKPLKVTRGNWRAIVDGTYDPANPPPEPETTGQRGTMAALPDHAKVTKAPEGTVATQINRTTRARIHLIDLGAKPRWKVVCAAHNETATTGDRAVANYGMTYSWGWCKGCRDIVGPKVEIGLPYQDNAERSLNALGAPHPPVKPKPPSKRPAKVAQADKAATPAKAAGKSAKATGKASKASKAAKAAAPAAT